MNHTNQLIRFGACSDAVQWADQHPSLQAAWNACERGDWMLWLMERTCGKRGSAAHRKLVLAACACARLTLPHVPAGEERPLQVIETAERWARRERGVTLGMVEDAAAYAATDAAAFAAREAVLRACADVVRSIAPTGPTARQMASALRKANGEE